MQNDTTVAGGYPANIENPDDWAAFLAHYVDNRATNVVHNGIGLLALHIVDAIQDARKQAVTDEIERLRLRLRKIANAPVPQTNEIAVMLTEWAQPRDGEVA